MPLVINALGADTQTRAHKPTHEPKQFQETRCTRPLATHAWFKNAVSLRKQQASKCDVGFELCYMCVQRF